MPRDHAKALEIETQIEELQENLKLLEEEQRECDPAYAEQSKIKRQTVSVNEIAMLQQIEGGRIAEEFKYQMTRVLRDIQDHPYRMAANGAPKAEKRSISICMDVMPIVSIDGATGRAQTRDMAFHVKVTSSLPKYQSAGSVALIEQTTDGIIKDVRINPSNPDNPRQLEFDMGDE
jgi:hypothetical protein